MLWLFFALCAASDYPFDPTGTHNVTQWIMGSFVPPEPSGLPMQLDVTTPIEDGVYPVFLFMPGFAGDIPSYTYQLVFRHIASHGYIVVGCDYLTQIDAITQSKRLAATLDWLQANLTQNFIDHGYPNVQPDLKRTALGGHSSACHTVVQYLNGTCGYVTALVLMDPVDGGNPDDPNPPVVINPPNLVPFSIPTLQTETGMDPLPLFNLEPPCAPANLSNDRFYNAWQSPIYQINATDYGHGDNLDPAFADVTRDIACPGNATNVHNYREAIAGLCVAFFNAVFQGETADYQFLTTPSLLPVASIMKHDLHGYPANTQAFCKHQ